MIIDLLLLSFDLPKAFFDHLLLSFDAFPVSKAFWRSVLLGCGGTYLLSRRFACSSTRDDARLEPVFPGIIVF
jgi:hypothetical protein